MMRIFSARRGTTLSSAALALILATACGDSRVNGLELGMSQDSVLKVIAEGAPEGDSLPNIYNHMQFFTAGKMFDVYLFDPQNRDRLDDPLVMDKELTPIVVVDGKLEGTGWRSADEMNQKYGIVIRTPVAAK